jgi:hypothetical protein|tara:strand:+ start:99 stop:281 length:183 start_codon:yes stop_codon:yes gene_type:complete
MKIPIGHKVLNLEELFLISTYSAQSTSQVEVVPDNQIFAELDKLPGKATKMPEFPSSPEF